MKTSRFSGTPYLRKVLEKSANVMPKMITTARNTFGYSSAARRIMLMGIPGTYAIYANVVLTPALRLQKNTDIIDRLDRMIVLCYGKFYRTVPYIPSYVNGLS